LAPIAGELPDGHRALITQAKSFWHGRATAASTRGERWRTAIGAWRAGQYTRFADGAKSFARDLLF